MATHVKVIAVCYLVCASMLLVAAFFTPLVLGLIASLVGSSGEEGAATGATILGFAGIALSTILLTLAIPFFAAGWGLLKFRPWARVLGIILAALCLTKLPLGTILGVYALIILFKKDTEALFVVTS